MVIEGNVAANSSTIPYSTPNLQRICCVTLIGEKEPALMSRMFVYDILLIPTSSRYPGQHFYDQLPDRAHLEPFRLSLTIQTTMPSKNCAALSQVLIQEWHALP